MIRHVLAGALAIVLIPAGVEAQTTLTIEAASIDVRESPTVASRVLGQVQQGRVLQVAAEDGDWVMVVWPTAADGMAYVRLTIGSLAGTERNADFSVSDVRADVEAVERAVFAIWEGRSDSTTALHDEPSR
jgi:hypothetical protein